MSSSRNNPARNQQPGKEQRKDQAIEADAAGFEGDDFVVFRQNGERDESGDQGRKRRELIDHQRNQIAEIVDHGEERDVVAGDVSQQIEKSERVENHYKGREQNEEVVEELLEHVDVDEHRKRHGAAGQPVPRRKPRRAASATAAEPLDTAAGVGLSRRATRAIRARRPRDSACECFRRGASRNKPMTAATMLAAHTPAHGEIRPCAAM